MNTDEAWKQWGKQDPYFAVLTADKFRARNLTPEAKAEFFESGRAHVDHVLAMLRKHFDADYSPKRVLDFGCGVGRLVVPFARVTEQVVGVDVSEAMLAEARRNCEEAGLHNTTFVVSDDALSKVEGEFDLVHSIIVFQHIAPERGREIFRRMLKRIAPGGAGAVQFTYAKARFAQNDGQPPEHAGVVRKLKSMVRRALRMLSPAAADPEMQMNVYPLNELLFMLQSLGVHDVHCEFSDHAGELGVIVYFRRQFALA